jgi:hypothetical protein
MKAFFLKWGLLLLGIIFLGMVPLASRMALIQTTTPTTSPAPAASPAVKPSMSKEDRAELVAVRNKACQAANKLVGAGVFTKVTQGYAGVTHAYVNFGFYALDVDDKTLALKTVAICHVDMDKKDQMGIVTIHDGHSGKEIGVYSITNGLDLD